jgi:uncharacterized protein YdcH (DUF465 family)
MSWKNHYISMLPVEEDDQSFDEQDFSKIKKTKINSKQKLASSIRNLAVRYVRAQKKLNRAQNIREVSSPKNNPKSLSSLIFQILSASETPLHIVDIIAKLQALGWKSDSQYHIYNNVHQAISNNYHMFEKVDTATYQIRFAYKNIKEPKTSSKKFDMPKSNKVSLKDIVQEAVKDYAPHNDLSARDIHYIVYTMGVNCSYSAICRALQDKRFKKDGKWYGIR